MPDKPPSLHFPVALLQQEGTYLLHAYGDHRAAMDARLGSTFLPAAVSAHESLFGPLPPAGEETLAPDAGTAATPKAKKATAAKTAAAGDDNDEEDSASDESALARQANAAAQAGDLTLEQNEALDDLTEFMTNLRRTARRAFKGQTVKLHDDYQIGEHDSRTLGDVILRAGIMLASARRDAAALQEAGGWTPADADKMAAALKATGGAEVAQVKAQGVAVGSTGDKTQQAAGYYELLLRLQNAANLEWPARKSGNTAVRRAFRLGIFPPHIPKKQVAAPTPPSPASSSSSSSPATPTPRG